MAWYGLRTWIEQDFKTIKRGFWHWEHTRMTDPARAERLTAAHGPVHLSSSWRSVMPWNKTTILPLVGAG